MGFYIWFDSNGQEVKREDKGRGKPKSGAIRQENGDWHIHEKSDVSPVVSVPEKATMVEEKPEEVKIEAKALPSVNQRVMDSSVQVDCYEMLKGLHITSGDILEDEDFITIIRPDVIGETLGIPEFYCRYCSFARFLINKRDLSLQVWRLRASGEPDYVIRNAFLPFE